MVRAKDVLGAWGEDVAAAHLVAAGMQVLDRRWRTGGGEIDVVARDGRVLVFVEVKTRSGLGFGSPLEAVTLAKQRRLRHLAVAWLAAHGTHAVDLRFDVVGVLRGSQGVTVEHVRAAF